MIDAFLDLAKKAEAKGQAYAIATVVRTVSVTAAKAGAKAIIDAQGMLVSGWIGGGCARSAVLCAARDALHDGQPRLVSVQPEEWLAEHALKPGEVREGVQFARNLCPSKGTMDIFVEPVLPRPQCAVLGSSPVARALVPLAQRMGFFVTVCAPLADHGGFDSADRLVDGLACPAGTASDYIVVATQGNGDLKALQGALDQTARYIGFVGSRKKFAALKTELARTGRDVTAMDRIHSPAGLDLGAITPDEIAFSIVAQLIEIRRRGQRNA
ncbi:XdhC Rossmann domain containing protein [Rhabdaerophilaceae bacterium]